MKGISLRWGIPSSQSDSDIHLELPPMNPADGFGQVCTLDGLSTFNYHRARVQLAHIQGQVFENLCAPGSSEMPPVERSVTSKRLDTMLENWLRSIPPQFRVEAIVDSMSCSHLLHMASLHLMYLECWLIVHGIYPADSDCIARIQTYSRSRGTLKGTSAPKSSHSETWVKCVELSRACLKLTFVADVSEFSMW